MEVPEGQVGRTSALQGAGQSHDCSLGGEGRGEEGRGVERRERESRTGAHTPEKLLRDGRGQNESGARYRCSSS